MRRLLLPMLIVAGSASAHGAAGVNPEFAYVQGRLAAADNRYDIASERFASVLRSDDDDLLKRKALDVALMGGEAKTAVRLASTIAPSQPPAVRPMAGAGDSMVALTRVAGAAAAGNWKAYEKARQAFIEPAATDTATPVIGRILAAWGSAAAKNWDAALAALDPGTTQGASRSYLIEHRAHMLGYAGRWPEAAEAYAQLVTGEGASVPRIRLAAASAALEAGTKDPKWRERGIALLAGGPGDDPLLNDARRRFRADPRMSGRELGGLITAPASGVAQLFLRVGADLARDRAISPALAFARLATFADPKMPEGWFLTADLMVRADRPELALDALKSADIGRDPYREMIAARRGLILAGEAQYDAAIAILAGLANAPDATAEDWTRLADVERRKGDFASAAAHFGKAIDLIGPDGDKDTLGQLLFMRGSSYEQDGHWAEAEPDLRRAVAIDPNNPVYLNYLGYSLLDRRVKIDEGRAMVAQAYSVAPENGAIIDSMGWGQYLDGKYPEAVELLEKAQAAEPSDPTIADHLGDALWRAGRKLEARYAWNAAQALGPQPRLAQLLKVKENYGLDMALASQ